MAHNDASSAAVFFDIDGTLLDTTYLHTLAWWRALDDAYESVPMANIHPLVGMGSSELLTTLLGRDDSSISRAHGRHFEGLHEFIRPLPGASDLIRRIAAEGTRAVIVTSAKKRDLPALLALLGCDEVIADVVHGEMTERNKPSPDLFALAVERAGCDPAKSLALADTIWDIRAAGRAGIPCAAVQTGGSDPTQLQKAGAIAVYPSCSEILECWDVTPFASVVSKEGHAHKAQRTKASYERVGKKAKVGQ